VDLLKFVGEVHDALTRLPCSSFLPEFDNRAESAQQLMISGIGGGNHSR
jgi:hypothetical protein